ncbi:CAP domain-containing protein [Zopfochytrium polystomum]|nr:CAP domain-containing protein [Zopfochytrium polystomum]
MGKGVSSWMDEDSLYYALSNGGSDPTNAWNAAIANNEEVGHFTQIIWGSTSRVGCASRTCKNGQWNVWMASCRYQARGNIFGANGLPNPLTA